MFLSVNGLVVVSFLCVFKTHRNALGGGLAPGEPHGLLSFFIHLGQIIPV